ncbi:hypothetical protein OfM1_21700 [Lactovum odontotermitis]
MKEALELITTILSSGVIIEIIRRNSNKSYQSIKEQIEHIDSRIDKVEKIQINQSKSAKKMLITSLLSEYDNASDEAKPWIAEKLNYEFKHYREPPINGNSWVEEEFKKRNLL